MSGTRTAEAEPPEIIVEVEDDTPEADRGRRIAPEQTDDDSDLEVPGEEIASYRRKVQKRLSGLSEKAHSERRAKEAAARERDAATQFAQRLTQENAQLRELAQNAERTAFEQAKQRTQAQVASAERRVQDALETGDPKAIVDAQTALHRLVAEDDRIAQYRIPERPAPQQRQEPPPQRQVEIPKPDARAEQWATDNPWFGQNKRMTATAYGIHEELVAAGVNPASEDYYKRIDREMRSTFPGEFKDRETDEEPQRPARTSVVAPATRSVRTPRTVTLTASQVALATRLGLTREQYAAQMVKDAQDGDSNRG
jgi:hypothetical protein